MTSVTLKMVKVSLNLVFALPWCFCVPTLMRIDQRFLQIFSENNLAYHLSYVINLNDLCDLQNEVKVTRFEIGL